jgi:predicted TIM-barrel fold metal-dependent hydrolase
MPPLDSDKVEKALLKKMKAERLDTGDWYYLICNEEGNEIASTSISKGAKEILSDKRVSQMSRQLRFDNTNQFVGFVRCTVSRDKALETINRNYAEDPFRRRY